MRLYLTPIFALAAYAVLSLCAPAPQAAEGADAPPARAVDAAQPTPVTLLDMAEKPRLRVNRAKENLHAARFVTEKGTPAQRFTWEAGSKQGFMEVIVLNPPVVHGAASGLVMSMPVKADGFPGFDSVGVRLKDAHGEIFRWSGELDPKKQGWQDVRIVIDPANHKGNWGGGETGKGVLDAPVQLASITLNAPKNFEAPASVLVGSIHRSELRERDVPPLARINEINVGFAGPRKAAVFDGDEPVTLALQNNGPFDAAFRLRAELKAYDGHAQQWASDDIVRVPAGETVQVPMNVALQRKGWWQAEVTLETEDRAQSAKRLSGSFAWIDAVGMRPYTPDDFQFGIGGTGSSDDTAAAATLIGSDWTRGGLNWNELEKEPGKYDWRKFDEQVERAEKFGYRYQHLVAYGNTWATRPGYVEKYQPKEGWWINTLAPQPEKWRQFVRAIGERYKGRVHYWEIWNEADLSGYYKGTTDDYIELLRIAHEELKSADPQAEVWTSGFATVTGHGGHNLNPDLQRRVIAEAQDAFDAIAHHEHGTFSGFQQALDGALADMLKALRSPKPLAFNETAIDAKRGLDFQAHTLVKKIAYAKARGAKYYSWFHIYRSNDHEGFGMLDSQFQPRPIYPAFNEIVRQLRNKRHLGDIDLGKGRFGLHFGDQTDQVILAWRENDDVADVLAAVRVPDGATVERIDIMGNAEPLTPQGGGVIVFRVEQEPAYIVVRGAGDRPLPVHLLAAPLANVPDDRPEVVQVTFAPAHESLKNIPVSVSAAGAGAPTRDISAAAPIELPLPQAEGGGAATLALNVSAAGQSHVLQVPIRRTVTIPSTPIDQRGPTWVLDDAKHVVSFYKNDPANAHRDWKGPADLGARIWIAREAAALHLRIAITDDRLHQPHTGNDIWKADSLQIGLQPPGAAGFYEIAVATRPDDPATAQLALLNRPTGADGDALQDAKASVTRQDGGLTYDIRLPIAALGLSEAALAEGFRFNLVVNDSDNDGAGRDGLIQIAPGIAEFKDARVFPVVRFR